MTSRLHASVPLALALVVLALTVTFGSAQPSATPAVDPLPTRPLEATVEVEAEAHLRIAVPTFLGLAGPNTLATAVLADDFRNIGIFQVLAEGQYPVGYETEALSVRRTAWTAVGADAVVKGEVRGTAEAPELELRLYEVGRVANDQPTLVRTYSGDATTLRRSVHRFANEVLEKLTGLAGAFDTQLVFARRIATGRKHIFEADYDGANLRLVAGGEGVSMFPAYGPDAIWFSRMSQYSVLITNDRLGVDESIVRTPSGGMNMSPTICDGRLYFTSTRDGNAEIYSARLDGSDPRRLTSHPALDVSPACGPNGMLAFVSDRQGSPQIWTMTREGTNPQRLTFRGDYNQTPSWCQLEGRNVIAFTGRDRSLDIFTIDVGTRVITRLTQAQGTNKDPTWSPDCRMIAFSSSRSGGGVYVANPSGFSQRRVLDGHAETLRWSPRR